MTFNTVDEAETFYSAYYVGVGFGIKQGDKGEANELICRREWVCNKEGTRLNKSLGEEERTHYARRETRTSCEAKLRISYNDASKVYAVKAFVPQHNHMLTTSNQILFIRSNRHVKKNDLALINMMTKVSIRHLCHAYEYMVEQSGGYKTVRFTVKDLYNKLNQQRRTTTFESDSDGTLSYLNALCYRVVLIFDSTCKTNVYNMPLVLFVGRNNHRGNIVFRAALI
ncbi:PREDICTED: protein FAR-RED IMPAIRED RESPONSE 1-like [Fragaria vesca subsp. vesca]